MTATSYSTDPLSSKRRRLAMGLFAAAAVMHMPASASASQELVARGQEPFWVLRLSGSQVELEMPGNDLRFSSGSVTRGIVDGHPRFEAKDGDVRLLVTVFERLCADPMSGMPFPVAVEAEIGERKLSGCGGETMTVLEGGWRVIRLGEALPPEGTTITIVFEKGGRVSGRSGCNRFMGAYDLTGEGLSFGPAATTYMACPPPQMQAERQFLEALSSVTRVTPGEGRQLRLMAGDRQVLVIDRVD